jgi:hypothetical protein
VVAQNSLGSASLGEAQSAALSALSSQIGSSPTLINATQCIGPITVAEWGDLSVIFSGGTLFGFDYNYGGWNAAQGTSNPPAPTADATLQPVVATAGGATIGDTVAQLQAKDPAAAIPHPGIPGYPAYLLDGTILFNLATAPTVSSISPSDVVGEIQEISGNC